jgi:hypothetical protein
MIESSHALTRREPNEEEAAMLKFINETPALLSVLYDLNLLPEQHIDKIGCLGWAQMMSLAGHWRDVNAY